MLNKQILIGFCLSLLLSCSSTHAKINQQQDKTIVEMRAAFKKNQAKKLTELLPKAKGHPLQPWAEYWELSARLPKASDAEIKRFLKKYQNTYYADRLRNDWLLLLGKKKRWQTFLQQRPYFIMNDDSQVDCYNLMAEHLLHGKKVAEEVELLWHKARPTNLACEQAAIYFVNKKQINTASIWQQIRKLLSGNYITKSKKLLEQIQPQLPKSFDKMLKKPIAYLNELRDYSKLNYQQQQLVILAIMRINRDNQQDASKQLKQFSPLLTEADRAFLWGSIGQTAALRQDANALKHFTKAKAQLLTEQQLEWRARAALREENWPEVAKSIAAMPAILQQQSAWRYWQAQTILNTSEQEDERLQAADSLHQLSEGYDFYALLARKQLQQPFSLPPSLYNITEEDIQWVKQQDGLKRSLYAYQLGLQSEGVREWNYITVLSQRPDKLADGRLMAAAQLACNAKVWYLCINTSERTQDSFNWQQRYPTPFKEVIEPASQELNLDPGLVYGLIRQESRFVYNIRSAVGAAGLMQVMPKTASWTAKKIGLEEYKPHLITDPKINVTLGTSYLRKVMDQFEDSIPMATAAYNAGPGRPQRWRKMPKHIESLDGALWVENIPFNETRNYVKTVLANTIIYQHILGKKDLNIFRKLGTIYPESKIELDKNLP